MKIGKIIQVQFDKFNVKLFHTTKHSTITIDGNVYHYGNIGGFVRTSNSLGESIICEVVSVLDYVGMHDQMNTSFSKFNLDSSRELIIKPIGTLDKNGKFHMGVGVFPSLYEDVEILTVNDLDKIIGKSSTLKDEQIHHSVVVGYSKNLINYRISLNINSLFNIHTAVLGNSGSGKSHTIASLLQKITRETNYEAIGSKFILFDANGEYKLAFPQKGLSPNVEVFYYKPNVKLKDIHPFTLPHYLMNLEEWLAFLMASDRTQKPFWDKVLQETYKFHKIFSSSSTDEIRSYYVDFFKWKILNILKLNQSHVDTDTARITASKAIILKCKELVNNFESVSQSGRYKDILNFLDSALTHCNISFGDNKGKLDDFITAVSSKINENKVLEIDALKLRFGDFYDFRFLKVACELVFLEEEARGNTRVREYTSTMLTRLDYFLDNPDCEFMRNASYVYSNVDEYLENVFGITQDNHKNQLVIIDSSEVDNDILELMTSVVGRMLFDYRKKREGDARRKRPIHLILDEAHRYIRRDAQYILKDNIFERIAREGRKFSLYLLISSQRPSELSSTVLSQCGNYIVHRIQNEVDMKYIYSVLPYFSEDYLTKIKQSVPGEALVFGNCVPMPIHIKFDMPMPAPNSDNCIIDEEWFLPNAKTNEETLNQEA